MYGEPDSGATCGRCPLRPLLAGQHEVKIDGMYSIVQSARNVPEAVHHARWCRRFRWVFDNALDIVIFVAQVVGQLSNRVMIWHDPVEALMLRLGQVTWAGTVRNRPDILITNRCQAQVEVELDQRVRPGSHTVAASRPTSMMNRDAFHARECASEASLEMSDKMRLRVNLIAEADGETTPPPVGPVDSRFLPLDGSTTFPVTSQRWRAYREQFVAGDILDLAPRGGNRNPQQFEVLHLQVDLALVVLRSPLHVDLQRTPIGSRNDGRRQPDWDLPIVLGFPDAVLDIKWPPCISVSARRAQSGVICRARFQDNCHGGLQESGTHRKEVDLGRTAKDQRPG